MKRILLLMWVLLLGISVQAQTTINVSSDTPLANQLANLSTIQSSLIITGTLTAEDFEALNSNTYSQLASVTKLDLSGATVASISDMSGMNLSAMEYLQLPNGMTSADDVEAMANLHSSSKNTALKMAGAQSNTVTFNGVTTNNKEVAVYSFVPNSAGKYKNAFPILEGAKSVRMAGAFGNNDLVDHSDNNKPIFGYNGPVALWDFTGASFTDCTIPSYTFQYQTESGDKRHFDLDDPFKETEGFTSLPDNYQTNSFYYFCEADMSTYVVDIKLPTGIESLPPKSLLRLGSQNKANYMSVNGMSDDDFATAFSYVENGQTKVPEYGPIETLVIPNNYEILDHECALEARIQHLYIGNGVKEIRGGAFVHSETLEDLDFAAGISDCYIGNLAFGECKSMKHIALAEGIVSLGANAFSNSQHLESIRLPESLIYIGNEAFNNCLALNSITIPSNVEKIGQKAFCLCPFTDIFLTTTNPDKIPYIWSAGLFGDNSGGSFDGNASFGSGHFWGWGGFSDDFGTKVEGMSWDEAAAWYYTHANGIPVLHYPTQLADKVKAAISANYDATSSDGYGLPANRSDMSSRSADQIMSNYPDVTDLLDGTNGKYTQNGWAQFVLMKEYVPGEEDVVFTKEYSDVWYTMCFPFDLTDEQLAAAFNETFNIADFSGVEVVEKTETDPLKLILHFNKVAVTYYKDTNDKIYYRLCNDGQTIYRGEPGQTVWREQHGNFEYNVYVDPDNPGVQYHHVHPIGGKLDQNKTKTFAISTEAGQGNAEEAILIDGILAEAGHPYMIHPAIGVNPGQPKKACNMAGISWKNSPNEKEQSSADYTLSGDPSVDDYRDWLYNHMARTVDLGHESTQQEKWDNYDQANYTSLGYAGNTYTFKGNHRELKKGIDVSSLPAKPVQIDKPKEPVAPPEPEVVPEPSTVEDPGITLSDEDIALYKNQLTDGTDQYNRGIWFDYKGTEITAEYNDNSAQWNAYNSKCHLIQNTISGLNPYGDDATKEYTFNYCKNLFNNYSKVAAYQQYLKDYAKYQQYLADLEAYQNYDPAQAQIDYENALNQYNNYPTEYNNWKSQVGALGAFVVIPEYAYFLGTPAGAIYPKYFRERESNPKRSTGLWTQYSAIIIPNATALAGLETDLGGVTSSSGTGSTPGAKSHDIAFDEDYFFINDTPQGIATLIEKIEKEEGKAPEVEYMDIVVSIDGKIVSRDKTTFEGLPKGVYIINGKKYYVK
ncbi:MAG: leucine-rich repeat domain-containing protein [Prevotella sp.]|nr:leucine-rich repeat domain-containing protein [Prevotella sp.]